MTRIQKILLFAFTLLELTSGFGRCEPATQSLSFTGPSTWIPGTTVTLGVNLTFSGYSAYGLSYWLEVNSAAAPFLTVTSIPVYTTFTDPNNVNPWPAGFNSTTGATPGFMTEGNDLGGTTNPLSLVPAGTYHITDITFSIAPGLPFQSFTIRSTTVSPRISEVTDNKFMDNNIIPAGSFVFAVIPEPSTLALLSLAAVGWSVLAYRRTDNFVKRRHAREEGYLGSK